MRKAIFLYFFVSILLLSQNSQSQSVPTITGQSELKFEVEGELHQISWIISDDNPKNYTVNIQEDSRSENETELLFGAWTFNETSVNIEEYEITVNVILEVGVYAFILRVFDYDDNVAIFFTDAEVGNLEDIDLLPGPGLDNAPVSLYSTLIGIFGISIVISKKRR